MQPFEIITTGRVGVDLYPQQIGVPLAEVRSFAKYLGQPDQCRGAAARLGSRAGGRDEGRDDGFGPFVRTPLSGSGSMRGGSARPELRTPIVFCECIRRITSRCSSTRAEAPDMNLRLSDFELERCCGEVVLDHRHRPIRRAEPGHAAAADP